MEPKVSLNHTLAFPGIAVTKKLSTRNLLELSGSPTKVTENIFQHGPNTLYVCVSIHLACHEFHALLKLQESFLLETCVYFICLGFETSKNKDEKMAVLKDENRTGDDSNELKLEKTGVGEKAGRGQDSGSGGKSRSNSPQAANNLFECIINRFVRKYLDGEILRGGFFPDGLR